MFWLITLLLFSALNVFLLRLITTNPWWLFLFIPAGIIISFLIFALFVYLCAASLSSKLKPTNKLNQAFVRSLTNLICLFAKVKIVIHNKENLAKDDKMLVVANHKNLIDPLIAIHTTKRALMAAAKKEVWTEMPYLKPLLDGLHCIKIDRENDRNTTKEIIGGIKYIQTGRSALIYPEGGIKTREVEQMVALKAGAYKLATKSEATIQPIATVGASRVPKKRSFFKPYKIHVYVLDPLRPSDYKDMTTHEIGMEVIKRVNEVFKHEGEREIEIDE